MFLASCFTATKTTTPSSAEVRMAKVLMRKPTAIILDMDGTTIPITYFPQKLLPFIKDNVKPFLIRHRADALVQSLVDELRGELLNDRNAPKIPEKNGDNDDLVFRSVVEGVRYIIDGHKRSNVFLAFNILITMDGYRMGRLEGE